MTSEKKEALRKLEEKAFREDVLIPLLKHMGYEKVRLRHGSDEHGKDITCCWPTPTNTIYVSIVAKVGDISGAASAKGKLSNIIGTIKNQIDSSFEVPIEDVTEDGPKTRQVNQVIVWTNGSISKNAKHQIMETLDTRFRNVVFKDCDETIDYLDRHYPAYFTIGDATISSYFEAAKKLYGRLEELAALGGLNAQQQLPTIFVAPNLERIVKQKSKQAQQENRPNQVVSFSTFLRSSRNTLILGDMGSGKTTIVRRMLLKIIEINETNTQKFPIPILLRFKKLDLLNEHPIEEAASAEFTRLSSQDERRDIGSDLVNGLAVVLLDGLDELQDKNDVSRALDIVRVFATTYPKTRVVITSRNLEIFQTTDLSSIFAIFRIQHLSLSQMKEFIGKWFGKEDLRGKELARLVSEPVTFGMILATPLTLALVAILYESGFEELPANLTELFSQYTELALGRWDMGKSISTRYEWRIKQLVLRKIGWDMQQRILLDIPEEEIEDHIRRHHEDRGLNVDLQLFSQEMIERPGLLAKNREGKYEFKHRAFQDYFAGVELSSRSTATHIAAEKFLDPWWSWTIFFACGIKAESEDYLRQIMDQVLPTENEHFHYAMQLGLVAQAAYLAQRDTKIEAVKRSLISFVDSWDVTVAHLDKMDTDNIPNNIWTHSFLVSLYCDMVSLALGSKTLASALSQVAEEILGKRLIVMMSSDNRAEQELLIFLLAVACAETENIDSYVELFQSDLIADPIYVELGSVGTDLLLERDWLSSAEQEKVKELAKKLKRKLGKNKDYLRQLHHLKPRLLSPKDSTAITTQAEISNDGNN